MNRSEEDRQMAERVRRALIERALEAHDDARLQGLCWEGAWEAAVSAMRQVDLGAVADEARQRLEDRA